jgi:O-antigen ligase
MAYVILALLAMVAVVSFFRPFVGLLGLLAINVIQPGELYPIVGALHIERVMAVVVLISSLMHCRLQFYPLLRRIVIFWGILFLTVPFSVWPGGAAMFSLDFGKIVIYSLLIANLIDSRDKLKYFLVVYMLLIGYLATTAFFFGGISHRMNTDRVVGLTSSAQEPNGLAATLLIGMPLILLLASSKGLGVWRIVALGTIAISIVTIVYTGSRSGFATFVIVCAIAALRDRRRLFIIPTAVLAILVVWVCMPTQYRDRYTTMENLEHDDSYNERIAVWKSCFQEFMASPVIGVGAGQAKVGLGTEYGPKVGSRRIWMQPHSLYLQALAETGIAGTLAFFTFVLAMIRQNLRLRRTMLASGEYSSWMTNLPIALLFSIAAMFIIGYAGHNLYRAAWYQFAGVTSALSVLVTEKEPEAEEVSAEEVITEPMAFTTAM